MSRAELPLECPNCGARAAADERFCPDCAMPLVLTGEPLSVTPSQEWARKIKKQYADGDLVKVGYAHNQAEAEFIAGLLLEEGVPSLVRRARGFDVPDFLAAGPRDILVPASGAEAAREVLLQAEIASAPSPGARRSGPPPVAVLAGVVVGFVVLALIVLLAS